MAIVNEVRRGFYLDFVALMRIARDVRGLDGVEEAGLMIGTPANLEILAHAGVLAESGKKAGAGDLVIAVRAKDEASAKVALKEAATLLDKPKQAAGEGEAWRPRSIRAAVEQTPGASLALISVPGDFAAAEARKALRRGLDVMIFSDNVPVEDEVALKQEARALGRMVMGPDCGTAIIGGKPLAFANVVPAGDIGIVGASGTGIQEISCLIAQAGRGISHAIGTGGRDLKADVGGITALMAIDAFDADPATKHVVLVSKPPAPAVAKAVLERIGRSPKPYTVCFLGGEAAALPKNAKAARLLDDAARIALGGPVERPASAKAAGQKRKGVIRGLYSGGSLCAEAQVVLRDAGLVVASNVAIPGVQGWTAAWSEHSLIDLGDDEYTRGRPHPMIEPAVRDAPLAAAFDVGDTAVVLVDIVLGFGGHMDPAGHLTASLAAMLAGRETNGPAVIASVTGTDGDPQSRAAQVAKLEAAGVIVAASNAEAAMMAVALAGG